MLHHSLRWLGLVLVAVSLLVAAPPPAQADSVVKVVIEDTDMNFITDSPANLANNTTYFLKSQAQGTNHPTRLEFDFGATISTYWTINSTTYQSHHVAGGSVTCSWVSSKYSCLASGGDYLTEIDFTATTKAALVVATFVARSASPTGLDTRQYTVT